MLFCSQNRHFCALVIGTMVVRVTAHEFMELGLELAGYKRWKRYKEKANIQRFKSHFGPLPKSCENIWIDLQTTTDAACRIESDADPKHLLLGLRFLWKYQTEDDLGAFFQMTSKTVRKWSHVYARKIQLLLPNKVRDSA